MSLPINSSRSYNPFVQLQSLLQPGSAQGNTTSSSDPLSQLLAAIDQQGGGASSSMTGAVSSAATSGAAPQFDPQTLQALFAMQANDAQSLMSQLDGAANSTDPTGQGEQSGQASGSGQSPLAMLTAQAGTTQTVANSNGSSTTTITYADGSTVTMTTPASGSSASGGSSAAGGANVIGNNLLEQLIQMQAQLLKTTTPQSIMTV